MGWVEGGMVKVLIGIVVLIVMNLSNRRLAYWLSGAVRCG
jgi:hypothetical protein